MQDTDYYYVEMGTVMRDTENEYIRWRYVANEDRTNTANPTDLSSLNGTYLLETDLISEYLMPVYELFSTQDVAGIDEYLANNYTGTICAYQSVGNFTRSSGNYTGLNTEYGTDSNEYKTSTIRRWMNYTGDNKVAKHASYQEMGPEVFGSNFDVTSSGNQNAKSNMVTDLNIDTQQDIIYNEIFARSLTNDLYADIEASNNNATTGTEVEVPSVSVEGLSDTNSDKFWLLSVAEANTLFTNDGERDWNVEEQMLDIWWLRSPYSSYTNFAYYVANDGSVSNNNVVVFDAARPAFQIWM